MSIVTLTWFTIGACLVYVLVQDSLVYDWLVLLVKIAKVWVERRWFRVRYNPNSFWVRYEIKRNADKMAKEILKEYKNR